MTCILDLIPGAEHYFCAEGKIFNGRSDIPIGECLSCAKPTKWPRAEEAGKVHQETVPKP